MNQLEKKRVAAHAQGRANRKSDVMIKGSTHHSDGAISEAEKRSAAKQ